MINLMVDIGNVGEMNGFDMGMIWMTVIPLIYLAVVIVSIYALVLLIKFLRRAIKYLDVQLDENTNDNKENIE